MPCTRSTTVGASVLLTTTLAALSGAAQAALPPGTVKLECGSDAQAREAQQIQKRGAGLVKRGPAQELQLQTRVGLRSFTQETGAPPQHFLFCDLRQGFALIGVQEGMQLSGRLLDLKNGRITEAGPELQIKADRSAYFYSRHEAGPRLQQWQIRNTAGLLLWQGKNQLTGSDGAIKAYLQDAQWQPSGELGAKASCTNGMEHAWPVKLLKQRGEWSWQPLRRCGKF